MGRRIDGGKASHGYFLAKKEVQGTSEFGTSVKPFSVGVVNPLKPPDE
jgi:hypothetical protein